MRVHPLVIQALLVSGTIIGTLGGARMPDVNWSLSAFGLALLVLAGLGLRFVQNTKDEAEGGDLGPDISELASKLEGLQAEAAGLALPDLVLRLSTLDSELVRPISERAPRMLKKLGTERFAEIFGTYASGERALARAWSAAADAHGPEALRSLEQSVRLIRQTSDALSGA